jgi:hypothetical protein
MTLVLILSSGWLLMGLIGLWGFSRIRTAQKRKYGRQTGDYLIYWGDREQSRFTD